MHGLDPIPHEKNSSAPSFDFEKRSGKLPYPLEKRTEKIDYIFFWGGGFDSFVGRKEKKKGRNIFPLLLFSTTVDWGN